MIAALFLFWNVLPIPTDLRSPGSYRQISNLIYCRTRDICLHEIGHKLDFDHGLVSQTPQFAKAVQIYVVVELQQKNPGKLPAMIMVNLIGFHDNSVPVKQELYANLFMTAKGRQENMPASLQLFYNWGQAYRLEGELGDSQIYWFGQVR